MATREEVIAEIRKRGLKIPRPADVPAPPLTPEQERAEKLKLAPVGSLLEEREKSFTQELGESFAKSRGAILSGSLATLGALSKAPGPAGRVAQTGRIILGSIAGASAGRAVEEALQASEGKESTLTEIVGRVAEEGKTEGLFTTGASLFGPAVKALKPIVGKALGVGGQKGIVDAAERAGIPLGIVDISKFSPVRGTKTVLGIFPFLAAPFSKATKKQMSAVVDANNRYLNSIAPNATLGQVGIDMVKAAKNTSSEFKTVTRTLYTVADDLAANSSIEKLIPSESIIFQADDILSLVKRPVLTTGKTLKGKGSDELTEFLEQLRELPENISIEELRSIQFDITDFFNAAQAKGFDLKRLSKIKTSTEEALSNIRTDLLPDGEALAIKDAYDLANKTYAQGIQKFLTVTAKKFEQVDKKIFKAGASKTGNVNADELALKVINTKSPEAIRDLRVLVGDRVMKKAAAVHLNEITSRVLKETDQGFALNAHRLEKELGFLDGTKESIEATEELLKGTGVTVQNLQDFIEAAKKVGDVVLPAKMVARRVVLGGAQSGVKALTGAAITGASLLEPTSLLASIPILLLLRKGAKSLTNPKTLKDMTRVMNETMSVKKRRIIAVRLIRQAFAPEPTEIKLPQAAP